MTTSLDILRPSPSPAPKPSTSNTLAAELEARSLKLAHVLSRPKPTVGPPEPAVRTWLVPDFYSELEHADTQLTDITNVTTDVDEEAGEARVCLLLRVKRRGGGPAMPTEAVTVWFWTREKGVWKCARQMGMRGVSGY
jgi:hypothetical protein